MTSTWQCMWEENLARLNEIIKYFLNSTCKTMPGTLQPPYRRRMRESKDPEIYKFIFDGSLLVPKSLVTFCSIGVDHALEQDN